MNKINNNNTTAILLLATAVMLIGGLAVTISQQAAFATTGDGVGLVTICHIPPGNPAERHTITVGAPSVAAHVREHGDNIGACQPNP